MFFDLLVSAGSIAHSFIHLFDQNFFDEIDELHRNFLFLNSFNITLI